MTRYQYAIIDGHKVFYREAGPRNGRTLILLHGFPSSSHMFRDLIPRLEERFPIIVPDYLGFGYSDQPGEGQFGYSFESLTAIIEKLLFQELGAVEVRDLCAGLRSAGWLPNCLAAPGSNRGHRGAKRERAPRP